MAIGHQIIKANRNVPRGHHVLWRNGNVVWMGPIGAPIEDVDCDTIQMHPDDYEGLKSGATNLR